MIINGTLIAEEIKRTLHDRLTGRTLVMGVILVGADPVSLRYVERKRAFGASIGVQVTVYQFEKDISQSDLEAEIRRRSQDDAVHGLIIQLPLPTSLDTEVLINLIDPNKDIDALGSEARLDSPVVRAITTILERAKVEIANRRAVVVGRGKLVGQPIASWLTRAGAQVTVIDKTTEGIASLFQKADILISGAGQPGLIQPNMLKPGVVLIDAGTSESSGKLAGDAAPECAQVAAVFTPVPGGVGPLTVAMLFQNLLDLNL